MRFTTLKKIIERTQKQFEKDLSNDVPPLKAVGLAYGKPFIDFPGMTIGTLGDIGLLAATAGVSQKAETPTENAILTSLLGAGIGAGMVDDLLDRKGQLLSGSRKANLLKTLLGAGAGAALGGTLGYNFMGELEE